MAKQNAASEDDGLGILYGLTDKVIEDVCAALARRDAAAVRRLVEPLHPADAADLFECLKAGQRESLETLLGGFTDPLVLTNLDEALRDDLIDDFHPTKLARFAAELESDDAVELIETLDEGDQKAVLDSMPEGHRAMVEQALSYPKDSAGRLMRREYVAIPLFWTVGETIDFMRSSENLPDTFYGIFAVGPDHKPAGVVMTNQLLRSQRPTPIADILAPGFKQIPAAMDQEDVAFLFRQYDLAEAAVVDESGRLVGVITVDDVVDVIQEEHDEDILKLGGVKSDDLYEAVAATTRLRLSWLLLNLATAVGASLVIGLFQAHIERVVALAVLMPIVASMGGNAGTQTLTVAVRALAVKELTARNALNIIGKEVVVGGVNGIIFAVLVCGIAYVWFDDLLIGLVIGAAMIINLFVAGLAGILVPLGLDRAGVDPAVASSVILTTITDVVGFFCFLSLAALVLF
ncbi:MAG: magnesium transporter [Alphaproteobacteria bacterium]|nr:magnesium transporter [Alphaproteobacteria bacterium]